MGKLALTIDNRTEYLPETDQEAAMQRYWGACQAGDTSAKLVLVESAPDPDPDPDPPPASPGAVSEVARLRIVREDEWLDRAGFALPPPLFAPGTRVLPVGDKNFRLERRRVEELPRFPDAANAVVTEIQDEVRRDVPVALKFLRMNHAGVLFGAADALSFEPGSFQQFCTLGGYGSGARYLTEHCDAELRSVNVNGQISARKDRDIVLRTRAVPGGRTVFATVTPTYAAVDTDQVLAAVGGALADARTEMVYDGSGIRATALWMPDRVVDLAAGDIFKVGVRVETDDTGRGRIRISGVVWRNRCLNLIIIAEGEVETVSAVHKGDPTRILNLVRDGVDRAREKVADFLHAWGFARTVKVDAKALLRSWVEEKKLAPRSAVDRDQMVEALLGAWHQEPGDTFADAVNAVTRAAHETPTWGLDFREELERQAARLVLVPR